MSQHGQNQIFGRKGKSQESTRKTVEESGEGSVRADDGSGDVMPSQERQFRHSTRWRDIEDSLQTQSGDSRFAGTKLFAIASHSGFGKSLVAEEYDSIEDIDNYLTRRTVEPESLDPGDILRELNSEAVEDSDWSHVNTFVSHKLISAIRDGLWTPNKVLMIHNKDQIDHWIDEGTDIQFIISKLALTNDYQERTFAWRASDPLWVKVTKIDWDRGIRDADIVLPDRESVVERVVEQTNRWLGTKLSPNAALDKIVSSSRRVNVGNRTPVMYGIRVVFYGGVRNRPGVDKKLWENSIKDGTAIMFVDGLTVDDITPEVEDLIHNNDGNLGLHATTGTFQGKTFDARKRADYIGGDNRISLLAHDDDPKGELNGHFFSGLP
jgi:hypothetical protein